MDLTNAVISHKLILSLTQNRFLFLITPRGYFLRALIIPTMYRIALAPKMQEGIFGVADTLDIDLSGGIELP